MGTSIPTPEIAKRAIKAAHVVLALTVKPPSKQLTVVAKHAVAIHESLQANVDAVGLRSGERWCLSSLPGVCNANVSQCRRTVERS